MGRSLAFFALIFSIGLSVASESAQAGINLSGVGGATLGLSKHSVTTPAAADIKGGLGFGGGLILGFGALGTGLEVGALYLSRKTTTTLLGVETSKTHGFLHVPVLFRFGSILSLGVGGYYDIALASGASSVYGLTAGPRVKFFNLFLDTRFNLNLKSDPSAHELLFLLGFMI